MKKELSVSELNRMKLTSLSCRLPDSLMAYQTTHDQTSQQRQKDSLQSDSEKLLSLRTSTEFQNILSRSSVSGLDDEDRPVVPPSTPNSAFYFEYTFLPLPATFPDLHDLQIPVVRNKGVKLCIEELGNYFACTDYKHNFLHFWFLDAITDCVWRMQDQFSFDVAQQKTVLAWVLFVFDLIRDPSKNFTQQEFFNVFKETILVAAEVIDEGRREVLLPLKLVKIFSDTDKMLKDSSTSTTKSSTNKTVTASSSVSANSMYDSVLEIQVGEETNKYLLKHDPCQDSEYDKSDSLASAFEKTAEEETAAENEIRNIGEVLSLGGECYSEHGEKILESEIFDYRDYKKFYQADDRTPSRFRSETSVKTVDRLLKKDAISFHDFGSLSKLKFLYFGKLTNTSSTGTMSDYVILRDEKWEKPIELYKEDLGEASEIKSVVEEEVLIEEKEEDCSKNIEKFMEGLKNFKIWEQRMKDLSDSNIGLADWQMDDVKSNKIDAIETDEDDMDLKIDNVEFNEYCNMENMKELREKKVLNFAVLWAIIDFVYDYFSDNFQYNLIKMALLSPLNIKAEKLNQEWHIPKDLKEDVTVFVKDLKNKYQKIKIKKKKPKPEPKPKKEKKTADDKKSKKKDESKKVDKKGAKADKTQKDKKSEKKTRGKVAKKELTEEEQALMLKQALLEAERLKEEMNKKFIFPLQDAIDDEFFMSRFENWQKTDWRKKGGQKAKGKATPKKK